MDDSVLIDVLVELAGREEELETATHTLTHHADREQHLRELQAEYEEDAARAREGDRGTQVQLRVKESEIRAAEAELALKRDRTVGVSDRRQYQALQDEVTALEQKLAGLENEALLLLAQAEHTTAGASAAADDAAGQAERGAGEIVRMSGESDEAGRARAELEAAIERLVGMLPTAAQRHVRRLRRDGGRSVVRVESGACGGCFGQLPAQQAIDADGGRAVVRCAGCARYVVHKPWR